MIVETLTSPIILFFALGMAAGFARSDLAIPEALAKGMALYLMAAIGLKGGVSVATLGISSELLSAAGAGIVLSFLIPIPAFLLLRRFAGLDQVNAGAVAAHYGSVSLVTFVTAQEMLTAVGMPPAGFMVAVLALMETPAIITGLFLARRGMASPAQSSSSRGLVHEVFLNASVVLLIGSFAIGAIAGKSGFAPIAPVFEAGYRGILCLFLLDMGLVASRRLLASRAVTARLALLAIAFPLVNGTLGTLIGTLIGLDVGSAAALGILCASASYIAVPAAVRVALPEANPGIFLSMSLGLTFPFNIIVGIPLFAALAQLLGGS